VRCLSEHRFRNTDPMRYTPLVCSSLAMFGLLATTFGAMTLI
jgi:hypothetical protein